MPKFTSVEAVPNALSLPFPSLTISLGRTEREVGGTDNNSDHEGTMYRNFSRGGLAVDEDLDLPNLQ